MAVLSAITISILDRPIKQISQIGGLTIPRNGYGASAEEILVALPIPTTKNIDDVTTIILPVESASERHFRLLSRFPNLENIEVQGNCPDEWFEHLNKCHSLRCVAVDRERSANALLCRLAKMENVKIVFVFNENFDGCAVEQAYKINADLVINNIYFDEPPVD